MTHPDDSTTTAAAPGPDASYARRLLHRWLIEFNPLYLLSAALVLAGTFLLSRGLADEGSTSGPLGVSAIAEVYAGCLIGGAALLVRIGHRRPAVMLALLTVFYQWDLTMHTERSPAHGPWVAAVWMVVFAAKLHALAWAMKIRLSRGGVAALLLAGLGLALFPLFLSDLGTYDAGAILAAWVFAIASLQRGSSVTSLVPLDAWGETVLRRAARAAWILSALLVAGHVLFWSSQWSFFLPAVIVVFPLLRLRSVRSEARVWALATGTLVSVAAFMPAAFSVAALLAAGALVLRALAPSLPPELRTVQPAARPEPPYRAAVAGAAPEQPAVVVVPSTVAPDAVKRLLTGAILGVYLSAWTIGWSGGPWPAHVLALDVGLAAVMMGLAWVGRAWLALVLPAGVAAHLAVQAGLVPAPRSLVEWGASAVGLGFVLLVASLAASYRLRVDGRRAGRAGEPSPATS